MSMILVDKKIKERHTEIFSDNCYDEKYVNAVSYDLHVSGIVVKTWRNSVYKNC